MSELKKYWLVIHYERELEAENEEEAYVDIIMGNTIVENATIVAQELCKDTDVKKSISQMRIEARKQAAISIITTQLYYKIEDYSLINKGLPKDILDKINCLSLEDIENLSIEILTMTSLDDLRNYLN